MDPFRANDKRRAVQRAEESGEVADSMAVRKALMARVTSGEITLAQAQQELKRIKRGAGKAGKRTRNQVWRDN